ncbi:MAG TPA: hypothetical protein VF635_00140 [Propionibacteriaceae bacterium]|jgi:putative membrane protein
MMYFGPGMGGWAMALMMLGNVIFWTVLILGAVVVARFWKNGSPSGDHAHVEPRQLLAERFARGEVTEDDYLESLRVLSEHHVSPLR